jgi:hypothetical protein
MRAGMCLNRAAWGETAAMSQVRRFAAAGLDGAARRNRRKGGMRVGALDETGREKHGSATAGVKRQYMGCEGQAAVAGPVRHPEPDRHAEHWLNWRRRHQARARWFHQRARLNREYSLVS